MFWNGYFGAQTKWEWFIVLPIKPKFNECLFVWFPGFVHDLYIIVLNKILKKGTQKNIHLLQPTYHDFKFLKIRSTFFVHINEDFIYRLLRATLLSWQFFLKMSFQWKLNFHLEPFSYLQYTNFNYFILAKIYILVITN